ncbi:MAG: secondary thiamine-phosphate synthase enzyme YjbQ [Deltaproteobacteria bacterium]|jgi:secondary thiamine-phosphate synthase enzyme|nr:secondary thiamine-phosphate synthase enzyme YjbQ [Deltaproteobacteria bacterium]
MTLRRFELKTRAKEGFYPITELVRAAVAQSQIQSGLAVVYCPHTTAGLTINENADPTVPQDLILGLEAALPDHQGFRHLEGNSQAHLKALVLGSSLQIIVAEGQLLLGTWQGIFFGEFDGPRNRNFYVKILAG